MLRFASSFCLRNNDRWRLMRLAPLLLLARLASAQPSAPASDAAADADRPMETILFFRHGEKPRGGLGQLSCQGLHRALDLRSSEALSARPDYLFAPNPSAKIIDKGIAYDYLRPLATIEPLAIAFGLPVNTDFGFEQLPYDAKTGKTTAFHNDPPLLKELLSAKYKKALVYVCWEHHQIAEMIDYLLAKSGTPPAQPTQWDDQDYDGVIRVTLRRKPDGSLTSVSVLRQAEGLSPASGCHF